MSRPEGITDEHREYLDALRDTGITNMMGGGSYLSNAYDLTRKEAAATLSYWMRTSGQGDR